MSSLTKSRLSVLLSGVLLVSLGCGQPLDTEAPDATATQEASLTDPPPTYLAANELALPLLMDTRDNPSRLPGRGWFTSVVIQNRSPRVANVLLIAKPKPGATYPGGSKALELQPSESVVFRPDNPEAGGTTGIPAIDTGNFEGSMIIKSDEPVNAVAMLANTEVGDMGAPLGKAKAYFEGLHTELSGDYGVGVEFLYPAMKSGFHGRTTTLLVQNVGPQSALTAQLEVTANDGRIYHALIPTLASQESTVVLASAFTLRGSNPPVGMPTSCTGPSAGSACFGSVRLWKTNSFENSRFAAIAVEHPSTVNGSDPIPEITTSRFHRIYGLTEHHTTRFCPVIKNQYPQGPRAATSGIALKSLSGGAVNVTIRIRGSDVPANPASGQTYTQTLSVAGNQVVVASPHAGTLGGFPVGGIGAATITANGPILAYVSEGTTLGGSYLCNSFRSMGSAPIVKFEYPNATSEASANSQVYVQNTSTQQERITGTFTCRVADSDNFNLVRVIEKDVEPGASVVFSPATITRQEIPSGRLCAVRFTAPSGELAMAVIETTEGLNITQRDEAIYEGLRLY